MNYQKDKPIIGVLGRIIDNKITINNEIRYAIFKSGGIPTLLIPNNKSKDKKYINKLIDNIDGLIIPGGSIWYEFDEYAYKYALNKDIPILGICMGMQMMCSVDLNNKKIKDMTVKNNTIINHKQNKKYVHKVKILDNTLLKSIIKRKKIKVNSRHSYHVENVNKLKISAYSIDGLIEGVEYPNKKFVIGVEWHPESTFDSDIYSRRIFKKFIHECKRGKKRGL